MGLKAGEGFDASKYGTMIRILARYSPYSIVPKDPRKQDLCRDLSWIAYFSSKVIGLN